ncbi:MULTISPECIES: bile acid:sodium symporter family protein [Streptomyces]|uniref:bile acid:sodium symporter family protein n=1 Tax=Streptomyces TaxID=1883 RepID=UPI00103B31D2|nr:MULTISPECIES: bile acid:sodium symporter family protein [Streptomyces]MBT3077798.1 bile acid:sodium symporter family protein [Streptomyces sp. COG21]MBT3084641.1 bile acid:sodium symporter family protein [Streptomyces sp. COG20]MBT3088770.1 bile acid:sodium symporter family protein [Streptomyces sp. CYG21]MBT3095508.1 bile acid:sodium symporter family protein [Streptomyces sp. CBG30]MBT3103411.1 bile acid:sodium symporter family protein [Streptomyces sp. COG19]
MNDSALITTGLPIALAIIMFGLGLSLTIDDFRRVTRSPKAVVVALVLQVLVLPLIAFGLVKLFDLDPLLAVGVMLLAASPGGTTANLFSHLFRGDVALNITLTAINSVLAAITIPIITNLAIDHFDAQGDLGLQLGKVVQVIAIVLIPVAIGMAVRQRSADFAARADRPVRIFSILVLVIVSVGALLGERENLADYMQQVGLVTGIFCLASLTLGYAGARLLRLDKRQAIASSMEVGIHNTTVALTIALSVLDSTEVAIPSAVYSVLMYVLAAAFGYLITRRHTDTEKNLPQPTG